MTKRVLIAMSGGVDSSLAAAFLLDQGFEVEGVTMKLSAGLCCDIGSAQAVCGHLGIKHHLLDMQAEFSRSIVDDFIAEYRQGRTPNPCIRCNDLVKFQALLRHARSHGFDFLATGHYARIDQDEAGSRMLLRKGVDENKDQSYFLYRLTQEQARHVLFPLGVYRKSRVRELARERRLPAAERPESQEVCFIPGDDYRAFLKERSPDVLKSGEMVMTDGTVVGRHEGIAFFTVGQRRKLGVAAGERLYVVRVEPAANRVVLGTQQDLMTAEALVSDLNLVAIDRLDSPRKVTVKVRYRSPFIPAMIEPAGSGRVRIVFDEPVAGVCPGQAAVFYEGEVVVGGGVLL